jgi:hypothetical protein
MYCKQIETDRMTKSWQTDDSEKQADDHEMTDKIMKKRWTDYYESTTRWHRELRWENTPQQQCTPSHGQAANLELTHIRNASSVFSTAHKPWQANKRKCFFIYKLFHFYFANENDARGFSPIHMYVPLTNCQSMDIGQFGQWTLDTHTYGTVLYEWSKDPI